MQVYYPTLILLSIDNIAKSLFLKYSLTLGKWGKSPKDFKILNYLDD